VIVRGADGRRHSVGGRERWGQAWQRWMPGADVGVICVMCGGVCGAVSVRGESSVRDGGLGGALGASSHVRAAEP